MGEAVIGEDVGVEEGAVEVGVAVVSCGSAGGTRGRRSRRSERR